MIDSGKQTNPQDQLAKCGLGRRVLVMLYDLVIVTVILMAVTALLLLTPLRDQRAITDILPTGVMVFTWFLYLAWCWRQDGLTLGMRAWRVRLVSTDTRPLTWVRCLVRFIVSILSFACLGVGFLRALVDPQGRTWHDLASNTRLVRQSKAA